LLESESLLNDATGITLFQIFLRIINNPNVSDSPSVWSVVPTIIKDIVVLSAIGLGLGLAFSMVAFYSLRWLRWRGAGNYIEATFVLAMSYLVYWVTEVSGGSGVIGVVTFGLFGNATMQYVAVDVAVVLLARPPGRSLADSVARSLDRALRSICSQVGDDWFGVQERGL